MATIEVEVEIDASQDKVWEVISDIDNEPKFWKGTKEVRNLSKEGNKVNREIIIAFRDQKCLQEVTLQPKEKIDALNDSEIFELLFTDGLSTAAQSDQYSGRGIGLAALKADILEQNGDAIFASKAGIGSTLTLVFPIR